MQITLKLCHKTLIVKLIGELDHHEAEPTRMVIERTIAERDAKNLIFDFSDLSFMDSSGIGMIIGRYKLIHSLGGQVALVCTKPQTERLITMSGLKKLMTVYPGVENALKDLKEA